MLGARRGVSPHARRRSIDPSLLEGGGWGERRGMRPLSPGGGGVGEKGSLPPPSLPKE